MNHDYSFLGCIPNAVQAERAHQAGLKSDVELRDELQDVPCPWGACDQPVVTTWDDVKDSIEEEAHICDALRRQGKFPPWWERAKTLGIDVDSLLTASQGNLGSCAGVSMFDRCYLIQLIKQISRGSEQAIEKVNAFVTWAMSKGGSRWGGQSIAAVQRYGAQVGVFPASLCGEYSASQRYDSDWETGKYLEAANLRQMQSATLDLEGDELVDAITLLARADRVIELGNGRAVSGEETDSNGVKVLRVSGSWSHAHMVSEYLEIAGTSYLEWQNTHGRIYSGQYGPKTGGLFDRSGLKFFLSGGFHDAAGILYVESPHGTDNLNLNPEAV